VRLIPKRRRIAGFPTKLPAGLWLTILPDQINELQLSLPGNDGALVADVGELYRPWHCKVTVSRGHFDIYYCPGASGFEPKEQAAIRARLADSHPALLTGTLLCGQDGGFQVKEGEFHVGRRESRRLYSCHLSPTLDSTINQEGRSNVL
jgi:hypothetical protein